MSAADTARALVSHLAAAGVRDVVLAPGSRSAPLAYALDSAERAGWLRVHVRVDERGAAFLALGIARAGMLRGDPRAVAVVTTSGTAVANLHPAVLEASHSGLPLVVVSADRPHELRGTGANQATIQPGVFAAAVRAELDMPVGFETPAVRGQVARLLAAALGTLTRDPGPVHLNVALREPLGPVDPWEPPPPGRAVNVLASGPGTPAELRPGPRTLVVAGDGAGRRAVWVARAAGWPLLAEPTSGARVAPAITHYQALLGAGLGAAAERVVVFGHPTLSRPVSALLARDDLEVVVVAATARWTDVAGVAAVVAADLAPPAPTAADLAWLRLWQRADSEMEAAAAATPWGRAARALWAAGGAGALVLGSSNTVRAFDRYAPPAPVRAVANRGLAGIDGTIATATGLALGLGGPVRAVVGDLTFLHDAASLARGALEPDVDLQVVVLNDHGGSIFATLEHGADLDSAERRRVFERYFAAPQELDIAALAAAFGAQHRTVEVDALTRALAEPFAGRSVLEVPLDRGSMRAEREAEAAVAAGVVERALSGLPDNAH